MPDILIHRCTLRVVRRRGWSWGPNPKRLLDEVIRLFPALLARKLQELSFEEDREIPAPVRIRIPIRLSDFMSEGQSGARAESLSGNKRTAPLEERVEAALQAAFGVSPPKRDQAQPTERLPSQPISEPEAGAARSAAGALPRLLLRWHAQGLLEARLASFSPHELEVWHRALWRISTVDESVVHEDRVLREQIAAFIRERAVKLNAVDRADRLRLRMTLATELAGTLRIAIDHLVLLQALDTILAAEAAPLAETSIDKFSDEPPADRQQDEKPSAPQPLLPAKATAERTWKKPAGVQSSAWEAQIACALPFLLLGPLSRFGYFDVLAAVLEASGLEDDASLFAAALAYKVLAAPQRGWRRDPQSCLAAAAFAGVRDPLAEEDLVDLSRRMALHTGPLDRLLTDTVIEGHAAGAPILLCRADAHNSTGFLLVDFPGCFPIFLGDDVPALLPSLRKLHSPILVSREAAGPKVLADLHAADFTFLSDVPPTRHESWHRVQQGPRMLGWSNYPQPESGALLNAAREMAMASEEGAALWETFGVARPAVVRARLPQLDRSLVLAAGAAAGTISWKLWQTRERTQPQLAVERFSDLDAHVRFDAQSVVVRLPLGRRHQELSESGLLAPVDNLPWLSGRRLEFAGG